MARRVVTLRVELSEDKGYSDAALQEWAAWLLLALDQFAIQGEDFNASDLEVDPSSVDVHHVSVLDVEDVTS